jgi:hypothetical protein
MQVAVIFSVPLTLTAGFGWRWRSEDYKQESADWFVFYADCVADAKRKGYRIKLAHVASPSPSDNDLSAGRP